MLARMKMSSETRGKGENIRIDVRRAPDCTMRASVRRAASACLTCPLADALSRPCKSRSRPAGLLLYLGAAGDSRIPANPQAAFVGGQNKVRRREKINQGPRTRCGRKNAGPNELCRPSSAACAHVNRDSAYTHATQQPNPVSDTRPRKYVT